MKKQIFIILGAVLVLSLSACSSNSASDNSSASSSASETSETSEVSSAASSDPYEAFRDEANSLAESSDANASSDSSTDDGKVATVNNEYDSVYLQWKYSNWESASDTDRRKCAEAYLGYYGDVLGWKVTDEDKTDEQLEKIEDSLSSALKKNPDFSVQEIILYILSDDGSSSNAE